MSERTGWVSQYENDPGDDSGGAPRPPIWVVIVVVVSVVAGGRILATQRPTDGALDTSPTTTPFEPSSATTTTASVVTTTTTASQAADDPVSVVRNTPIAITGESRQHLRGYFAVASADTSANRDNVQMFRPGGSMVSRSDNVIRSGSSEYPMLITAGHLLLGSQMLDMDLAEPPISLWSTESVIPGSGPGVVWLAGPQNGPIEDDYLWISKVDVESLTVGERVDITDLFSRPIVGVADGLIVVTFEGEFAYWSPTDGLMPLDLPGEDGTFVTASGDFVVVASPGVVRILDVVIGEYVSSFALDFAVPVTSACLSPDGQHVIIVGWAGEAVVGNTTTGEIVRRLEYEFPMQTRRKHGIGWTTNDQLVIIGGPEGDADHIFTFDIESGQSFVVFQLDGAEDWLAASGTMC